MLNFGNKEFRNLQEQVLKNMNDIQSIEQGVTVLANFGIKVVGQVSRPEDLPNPLTYEGEYGDAYLVGLGTPYNYYIFTRPFEGQTAPSWFNLGIFPQPGPRGPQGEQGEPGVTPTIGATVGSTSTLQPGQPATASVSVSGTAEQPTMTFSFAIPQGAQGIQGPQGATGPQGPQGQKGDKGEKGEQGGLIEIVGIVADEDDLPDPVTLQKLDAAYLVGSGTYYELYIQIGSTPATALWTNVGPLNEGTLVLENGQPQETWDADTKVSVADGFANNRVYAQLAGTGTGQAYISYGTQASNGWIVQRDANGQILVPQTPTADNQAASKKYVDDHASSSPIQHQGDIIVGNSSGEESRLAIGSAGQVLTVNSTGTGLEYTTVEGVPSYTNTDAGKSLVVNSTGTDVEWQAIGAPANMVTTNTQQTVTGIKTLRYLYVHGGTNTAGSIRLGCGNTEQIAYMSKITGRPGTGSNSTLEFNLRDSQSGSSLSTLTYNNASIAVDTTNTCDLGANGKAWKDIYVDGYLKGGNTSCKVSDIATKNFVNDFIVANPDDTATGGTLTQIDIGGVVYDLPSGGGGDTTNTAFGAGKLLGEFTGPEIPRPPSEGVVVPKYIGCMDFNPTVSQTLDYLYYKFNTASPLNTNYVYNVRYIGDGGVFSQYSGDIIVTLPDGTEVTPNYSIRTSFNGTGDIILYAYFTNPHEGYNSHMVYNDGKIYLFISLPNWYSTQPTTGYYKIYVKNPDIEASVDDVLKYLRNNSFTQQAENGKHWSATAGSSVTIPAGGVVKLDMTNLINADNVNVIASINLATDSFATSQLKESKVFIYYKDNNEFYNLEFRTIKDTNVNKWYIWGYNPYPNAITINVDDLTRNNFKMWFMWGYNL